jgi:hypothetical protein
LKTIVAEAMLARGLSSEPVKIISSVLRPRKTLYACSPNTQRNASAILDFPDPLGPTMAVTFPGKSNNILLAKVLYP